MAQTPRTFAQLEALLASGGTATVSAQDIRDFLESSMGCYGSIYTDGGSTPEAMGAAMAKIDTWLSDGTSRNATPAAVASGNITITAAGIYRVSFSVSGVIITAGDRFGFEARLDGAKVAGLTDEVSGALGVRIHAGFERSGITVTASQVLDVYGQAVGAAGDLTIENAQLSVERVG